MQAQGYLTVPAPVEHLAKAALANHLADLQLLEGYVPLLQEDAGLAGLAREVASRQQGQVHLLELVARVLVIGLLVLRSRGTTRPTGHVWSADITGQTLKPPL